MLQKEHNRRNTTANPQNKNRTVNITQKHKSKKDSNTIPSMVAYTTAKNYQI